jgi:hypothetical protein
MRRRFSWIAVLLGLALSACSMEPAINHQVVDYFDANDVASNQVILRNILRARDGAPLHFSELTNIRGVLTISANASTTAPYGSRMHVTTIPMKLGTLGVSVSTSPSFDVNSLDTKTFTDGVMKAITPDTAAFFLDEGLDYRLLLLLLTSGVLTPGSNEMILNAPNSSRVICYRDGLPPFNQLPGKYELLNRDDRPCPEGHDEAEYFTFMRIVNNLHRVYPIIYKRQAVVLCQASADPQKNRAKVMGVLTNTPYEPFAIPADICSSPEHWVIAAASPSGAATAKPAGIVGEGCNAAEAGGAPGGQPCQPYVLKLRSTLEIIQYVGQILAFQASQTKLHSDQAERCVTLEWEKKALDDGTTCKGGVLFRLEKTGADASPQHISVAYNGESWSLPAPQACTGAHHCDHTLETISIISLLLNQNKSAQDKYQTPAVQAVP